MPCGCMQGIFSLLSVYFLCIRIILLNFAAVKCSDYEKILYFILGNVHDARGHYLM